MIVMKMTMTLAPSNTKHYWATNKDFNLAIVLRHLFTLFGMIRILQFNV